MTEQQRPDEDVEGHSKRFYQDPDAPEGSETAENDTEGHRLRYSQSETAEDDVEGHARRSPTSDTGDDDVEGHMPRRPL
jgi:hypothetical protein